ncbi:MAG: tryptophan synthase subunit alpha [Myxococcota bacterium]
MPSRISDCFSAADGQPLLVTYITGGDPDLDTTVALMRTMADNGADLLELGVPFSDPVADGPTIQRAAQRALSHPTPLSMPRLLEVVRQFRTTHPHTPLLLFGYYNPFLAYGLEKMAKEAAEAGVDAFLVVNLPPEEASPFKAALSRWELDMILLVSPNTPEARVARIAAEASGFIYYVSITGVTGTALSTEDSIRKGVATVRRHTDLPVCVGFGIRTPEDAARVGALADGVVVGSALVGLVEEHGTASLSHVGGLVAELSGALQST